MSNATNILMVGPSPALIGGMSAVMQQILDLDLAGRFRVVPFPTTRSPDPDESCPRRVLRHVKQRMLLGRRLRDDRFAIVHIHSCSGFSFHRSSWDLRVARRNGCRTVLHMHGAQFDDYFANASRAERAVVRRTLRMADRVIALSRGWRERIQDMESSARICVIENAVKAGAPHVCRKPTAVCRFLMLARMDTWKGLDDLLEACFILRNRATPFFVTLAGPEGSAGNASQISVKIHKRGLDQHISYIGPIQGETKSRLLAGSDVLVQPSHHEGLPITILEAYAGALPVIATSVGAVPEVMEDDVQGFLVPARHPAELARAMGVLAMDPPRRMAMGQAGLRSAQTRFSITRFRDDLLDLYDDVLRKKSEERSVRPVRRPIWQP